LSLSFLFFTDREERDEPLREARRKAPRPFMDPGVAEATPSLYFFSYFLPPSFSFSWDLLEKEGG